MTPKRKSGRPGSQLAAYAAEPTPTHAAQAEPCKTLLRSLPRNIVPLAPRNNASGRMAAAVATAARTTRPGAARENLVENNAKHA